MEHLIFFIISWLAVFIIIPFDRIKELRYAALVSIIWMLFVDNVSSYLRYYSFGHTIFPIGRASLFQLLGYSAIGILMINWLREDSFTKLLSVSIVAISFSILQYIYLQRGALYYGNFNMTLNFIHSIAALAIFVWISLTVIGEENVYNGTKKQRFAK